MITLLALLGFTLVLHGYDCLFPVCDKTLIGDLHRDLRPGLLFRPLGELRRGFAAAAGRSSACCLLLAPLISGEMSSRVLSTSAVISMRDHLVLLLSSMALSVNRPDASPPSSPAGRESHAGITFNPRHSMHLSVPSLSSLTPTRSPPTSASNTPPPPLLSTE